MSILAKMRAFPLLEKIDKQNAFGQVEQVWKQTGEIRGTFVLDEVIHTADKVKTTEVTALFLTQERGQVMPGINRILINSKAYDVLSVFITDRFSKVDLKVVEEADGDVSSG